MYGAPRTESDLERFRMNLLAGRILARADLRAITRRRSDDGAFRIARTPSVASQYPPAVMKVVDLTTNNADAIVQHITSPLVTSAHIDVTFQPIAVAYASPKHFVFPSKRQLYWMDANRWVRQRIKESKVTSVSELASISCSINNIGKPVNASIRIRRTRTELVWLTIINAFHRLRFTTKTLR